jgi:hypothetical protein
MIDLAVTYQRSADQMAPVPLQILEKPLDNLTALSQIKLALQGQI